jgi:hypothetical protein
MAVTANQVMKRQGGNYKRKNVPCAASIHIYEGTHVFLDAAGRATNVIVDATTIYAGIAITEVDNSSGAADALNVEVWADGDFEIPVASVALADQGVAIYAVDNYTLSKTATGHPQIGTITKFVSTGIGIVTIRGLGEK